MWKSKSGPRPLWESENSPPIFPGLNSKYCFCIVLFDLYKVFAIVPQKREELNTWSYSVRPNAAQMAP